MATAPPSAAAAEEPAVAAPPSAVAEEPAANAANVGEEASARTDGLRLSAGLFVLGHAKRPSYTSSTSMGFAPGLSVGAAYRWGAWELELTGRAAYMRRSEEVVIPTIVIDGERRGGESFTYSEETRIGAAGLGARWFAAPDSPVSAYLGAGAEVLYFDVDELYGVGAAFRAAAGVEVWHDRAHHRLAIEAALSLPTFRVEGIPPLSFGGRTEAPTLYVVPMTLGARWTF